MAYEFLSKGHVLLYTLFLRFPDSMASVQLRLDGKRLRYTSVQAVSGVIENNFLFRVVSGTAMFSVYFVLSKLPSIFKNNTKITYNHGCNVRIVGGRPVMLYVAIQFMKIKFRERMFT